MASDLIGVLGEATTATLGTTTAYTVPVGKAAKCSLMYRGQAGAGGTSTLNVAINGLTVFGVTALTASHYIFSSSAQAKLSQAGAPAGATLADTVGVAPQVYFLNAGDTVTYTIGGENFTAMNFQVVGAEVAI